MTTPGPTLVSPAETRGTVYNQVFWLAYLANLSLVTANALTFRFAEFVAHLGGTEQISGAIVGTGTMGALAARLVLGQAIDRYGTRLLWTVSSLLFIGGCALFLLVGSVSWPIYVARIGFAAGMAGMFTCSVVHIQNQVPFHRRAEIVGTLGTSGFLGIITGSLLGDWMLAEFAPTGTQFGILFGTTVVLGIVYVSLVVYLTRSDVHLPPHETPPAHRLLFRYWPGPIIFVALMMGVGFTATTVFLTRFATERGLRGIGTFFTVYALTALVFRLVSRRWCEQFGPRPAVLMGLAGHCVGHCVLPLVTADWHFVLPAALCGFGHALLFPVVVSAGAGAFPQEYRGTGTTLVLGFVEVGAMLSAPVLGGIIDGFGFSPMFYATAASAVATAIVYVLFERRTQATVEFAAPEIVCANFEGDDEIVDLEEEEAVAAPFPHLGRSA